MNGKGSLTTTVPMLRPRAANAQAGGETALAAHFFHTDWSAKEDNKGHARISGYLYNDYGQAADQVPLGVTELNASGPPIAADLEPITDTVPASDRTYFDVKAPGHAASYRVAVCSFSWVGTGLE
jgi:hypothetical protein